MTRTLLIIMAAGALVCAVSFGVLGAVGGLKFHPGSFNIDFDDEHEDHESVVDKTPVTRDLPWAGGEALHIDVPSTIVYTQGPQTKFTVSGAKSVIDSLRFDDGELVQDKGSHWNNNGRLTITVTSPGTHDFHLAGAQQLTLHQYDQDSLELHISGAAQVTGEGRAKRLDAHMSGAGELDLGKLKVDDAVVSIAGAGDATLDPRVSADIRISGAGHVDLKTRPPSLTTHIAGFGSVDHP